MVDSRPRAIIGMMPARFRFLDQDVDLILPFRFDRAKLTWASFNYQGIGPTEAACHAGAGQRRCARMVPLWLNAWPSPPGLDKQFIRTRGSHRRWCR